MMRRYVFPFAVGIGRILLLPVVLVLALAWMIWDIGRSAIGGERP